MPWLEQTMAEIQNMVGGFLSSAVSNIFSTNTNIYMAVGITIALLVGTYFIYKWYATSVANKKQVQFAESPQAPPHGGAAGPHLEVHEMPPNGASMMPPNVEAFESGANEQEEEQQE
jgi:hypothetical protein